MRIKVLALVIVLSLVFCCNNLFAKERKNFEFNLSAAGVTLEDEGLWIIPGGVVSLGYYPMKEVGIELGGIIIISEGAGALFSGNVVLSPPNLERFIPYAIGGVWTTTSGGFGWNIGGGLKIKLLNEGMAIRAEYRRWAVFEEFDWGVNFISCGLSFFF
ncbi:MAG: hypothetical protein GTO16_07930 [Candidatus Aminicenantes bacterium]|nr:hypothetical protein [Candidatus Aminicenantes bacterium]